MLPYFFFFWSPYIILVTKGIDSLPPSFSKMMDSFSFGKHSSPTPLQLLSSLHYPWLLFPLSCQLERSLPLGPVTGSVLVTSFTHVSEMDDQHLAFSERGASREFYEAVNSLLSLV